MDKRLVDWLKVHYKALILFLFISGLSTALGFALENVFFRGLVFELTLPILLPPALFLLAFFFTLSSLIIFSLVVPENLRLVGYVLAALGFSLAFLLPPAAVSIPRPYPALIPLFYLGGLLLFDRAVQRAKKDFAVFAPRIFSAAYSRFFFAVVVIGGILVFFSAAQAGKASEQIRNFLGPTVGIVSSTVAGQIMDQRPPGITDKQFFDALKQSGTLDLLEGQFGLMLTEKDLHSKGTLAKKLAADLTRQLVKTTEQVLGPWLAFLPIVVAAGTALSLLILSPVITFVAGLFFALVYRLFVFSRLLQLVEEERKVIVLKLA